MMDVGRVCVKIAGRDAGLRCVVVEVIDSNYVMIDGQTRRRKCNIKHLEPLPITLPVKKGASHDKVATAFKTMNIAVRIVRERGGIPTRPRRKRKGREKIEKAEKKVVKSEKKKAKTEKKKKPLDDKRKKKIKEAKAKTEKKPVKKETKAEKSGKKSKK